jgi:hypothetical protein
MTYEQILVLECARKWYKNNGDKKTTDELWFAVAQMCEKENLNKYTIQEKTVWIKEDKQ